MPTRRVTSVNSASLNVTKTRHITSGKAPVPPYDKVKPIYVDVAFLPGGGNSNYVDAEWFKRVRARYYVATDVRPTCSLLESLVVGKESWSGKFELSISALFINVCNTYYYYLII
ncbi:unnamed protein product [Trichobilharzia regenti]|nr:unnamed protein product [Trichobilharzia regenti]